MNSCIYVTEKQSPSYHQMTIEEFLFSSEYKPSVVNYNKTNTRTYVTKEVNEKLLNKINLAELIGMLLRFNEYTQGLQSRDRESLYTTFYVPKRGKGMPFVFKQISAMQKNYIQQSVFKEICTLINPLLSEYPTDRDNEITVKATKQCSDVLRKAGIKVSELEVKQIIKQAYRRIDAPNEELKGALYNLKSMFEDAFGALYHTSAFAYIKNRSTVDAVKRHQTNESKWFAKYDLSNFFGSTTVDFIMQMFSMIFPFSEVVKHTVGREELRKALSLCVLNGVLPQGTPISPTITNIMMIPIDHELSKGLRDFGGKHFVYTRYADDFIISSKYDFNYKEIEDFLTSTLKRFDAPFIINSDKTRYGSSAGSNWNLGVMLNKDNKITVGYKKKRQFKAMLSSYVMDKQSGKQWDKSDVHTMEGYRNYYRMVEGETIDKIVEHVGKKFDVDIVSLIKEDLRQ